LRFSTSESPLERGPFLGEHTTAILADVCGYSEQRIEELAKLGVFGPAEGEAAR